MHQLANDLSKMSVSKEFASRSLRQHLNLGPASKKPEVPGLLSVGEPCLAKYWEDGKVCNKCKNQYAKSNFFVRKVLPGCCGCRNGQNVRRPV